MGEIPTVYQHSFEKETLDPSHHPPIGWQPSLVFDQLPSQDLKAEKQQGEAVHKNVVTLLTSRETDGRYDPTTQTWIVYSPHFEDDGINDGVCTYRPHVISELVVGEIEDRLHHTLRNIAVFEAQQE